MLSINRIKDGKLLINREEILLEVRNLYTNLYAEKQNANLCGRISTKWFVEQTAPVKGRTIIQNLQLNRDIISFANTKNLEATVITLDQEKAFDRVDRKFRIKTLKKFGYGPKMISIIEALYHNIVAQIKINGNIFQSFPIETGVRQGCPLLMILYIILADVMIMNIIKNKDIKEITVAQKEFKVSAFADDTTLYVGDNKSFPHLKHQLQEFELFAEVKYNRDKCFGLWLGKNKYIIEQPLDFNWNSYEIKILGYIYGSSLENWLKVKTKIQQSIKKWNNPKLSLIERKTIMNQVLLSKIWYLAYVQKPPKAIIQEIERNIYNFLWNYKKIRINKVTIQMPIKEGGLEIIHVATQFKAIKCHILAKFLRDRQTKKTLDRNNVMAFKYLNLRT